MYACTSQIKSNPCDLYVIKKRIYVLQKLVSYQNVLYLVFSEPSIDNHIYNF